ncbi:winged helix DNA-binding domain-containing protein [Kibdelosporangium aridum]|uniref:winged helix DNA-binding domain-containing protein n=1 Tax=Kibdelosporangium aridum TaxID=2030 RepID=UPI0035EB6644
MTAKLTRKALNRATLARQLLLERSDMPIADAIEHLVGLQAQTTHTWYHGLWSRLTDFDPHALSDMLKNREVVRMALMRSTIHLVTSRDSLAVRPLIQGVIERMTMGTYGKNLVGLDQKDLIDEGRKLLDEKPMSFTELGKRMGERWPDRDEHSLAYAVRAWVPLVQIPPRGLWGGSGQAVHSTVETWLGQDVDTKPDLDKLILRYLAAFGPASVKDAQTWSGLTRLAEVFNRLRPQLATFVDENGQELFDLPDAPRPAASTPTPVRYLYDFDNLLLSHHDRSRVLIDYSQQRPRNGMLPRLFLVDGFTTGWWTVEKAKDEAVLVVHPYRNLLKKEVSALTKEGLSLLEFYAPDAEHDIRFECS